MSEAQRRNPLMVPLIAVSFVAVVEAIVLVMLLTRDDRGPAAVTVSSPPPLPATVAAGMAKVAAAAAAPRGKVGERVESGGFGITIEKTLTEPQTYKDQVTIGSDQRYLALLVRVDNNTGGNAQLFPSQFTLKDDQGFNYDQLGIHGTMPVLECRTLANRETVRGHVDFVVPKSAKGLTLVYSDTSQADKAQPIQIDLGQ